MRTWSWLLLLLQPRLVIVCFPRFGANQFFSDHRTVIYSCSVTVQLKRLTWCFALSSSFLCLSSILPSVLFFGTKKYHFCFWELVSCNMIDPVIVCMTLQLCYLECYYWRLGWELFNWKEYQLWNCLITKTCCYLLGSDLVEKVSNWPIPF